MIKSVYQFQPEEFIGVLNLSEDLSNFYRLLENYKGNKTKSARLSLEKHSRDMFFTIKHRELEGNLTHENAEDLRGYMRYLLETDGSINRYGENIQHN